MLGAILGDIVGSRYEWHNIKSKTFDLMTHHCRPTDDSVMTLAIANALLACDGKLNGLGGTVIRSMQNLGNAYPNAGYGGSFIRWLSSADPQPYNSWGNGAAMRVSPCAWAATSLDEALRLSECVTAVTHNHPEGIKGAAAVTAAIYLARTGSSILDIRDHLVKNYYPLDFTLDDIRPGYAFDVSCQGSVPQALEAFLESTSFEDAIRNAISIGGDSDTIAAITGSIAEAYYGIPGDLRRHALTFLDERQLSILNAFEARYGTSLEHLDK
ncbi:MAG: ADP-ribosylglycohydrolase family protein [Kiritimatiellae bacterium]|nr:ADP-ribosylglycohydrolase family protein [Kiritimatiellia bacterium]